ncbi:MAG: right-handed parallel beta-helix repeat-containing protein, partial [Thermoplasmata archaeon]|nr:right-handed parallel beta-helix repeat-containing protein [Thermoplasmata archaeon]
MRFSNLDALSMRDSTIHIIVSILVIMSTFYLAIAIVTEEVSGTTFYVGGTGPGNYTTIQSAIDDAGAGNTVFVYKGKYLENVIVDKPLNLTGEGRNTTLIDGSGTGDVVYISANWVNVTGFTIANSDLGATDSGIKLWHGGNSSISNSSISANNGNGVYIVKSENNTISSNVVSLNGRYGIFQDESRNNTIVDNEIFSNNFGIRIEQSSNCNMSRNTARSNDGVLLFNSDGNYIVGNSFSNGWVGISLGNSDGNLIIKNNASSNGGNGIQLSNSNNNHIGNNTFSWNGFYGVYFDSSNDNTIVDNTISSNIIRGIHLTVSTNNRIYHNNIINNTNQADDDSSSYWDNGYPSGGNYWSDY